MALIDERGAVNIYNKVLLELSTQKSAGKLRDPIKLFQRCAAC